LVVNLVHGFGASGFSARYNDLLFLERKHRIASNRRKLRGVSLWKI
jgi:hypothetical protein